MPKHGCCLGSPPSGRSLVEARRAEDRSCLPRERSRSPSRNCQPSLLSVACPETDADHGPLADGLLPLAVCRAVTRVIWSAARAQAEVDHAEKQGARAIQKGKQACETSASAFPMTLGSSEPSQTQSTQPEDVPSHSEEVVRLALSTLASALAQANGGHSERLGPALCAALRKEGTTKRPLAACATGSPAEDVVLARVRTLSLCAVAYWREVSQDLGRAASSLSRFLEQQRHLYWKRPPYRGVNLGGWLLLEPGPSHELFQTFGPEATCEWRLLDKMRKHFGTQKTTEAIQAHRASFISEEDFRNIRSMGFNAVRIPFGYWIVTGPAKGELYVGPGLDFLDRALTWCQRLGLQALLDLHGAPGGESGEKPCGRERKDWRWEHWRLDESIEALRVIARRYKGHPAVSGIAVCNEPSEKVPADVLCHFYDEAVRTIRTFMPPDEVSIVLPVYRTERLDEIWRLWNRVFDGFASHANVAFDLHLYHCFGAWWQRQGLGSHLRMTKRHRKILRRVPAVVGEWSLALPDRALAQTDIEEAQDQAYKAFAAAQLDAYSHASHGWFFWNWCDSPAHHPGWDARTCFQRHWLAQADLCKSGAPLIPVGGV